jgi:predicted ATPase/DNA-binding SARP family transcriptional activator
MQELSTFGAPALRDAGSTVPFAAERRYQLLCVLARRADWVRRDELLGLFWAEQDASSARRNLRGLLFDLRQAPWLEGLEARADSIRWNVHSDLGRFQALRERREWGAAAALVRGPFLDGMEVNAPPAFTEWLRFEREWVTDRWRDAIDRHLESLGTDADAIVEAAATALGLDPLNESVVGSLMAAHARAGRRDAAQRAFEAYRDRLARDLGVGPPAAMRARLEELTRSAARATPALQPSPAAAVDDFVGRRTELRELAALLARPDGACVTILGPGGIGKSSLARVALARAAPDFPDGAFWVQLREAPGLAQAAARIAQAVGLELRGDGDAWRQVGVKLGGARALLVLDNCEHLAELRAAVERLASDCPGLKLLLTSRARLGGPMEQAFPLAGLPAPDPDEVELEAVRAFDAVRLFETRARAASPGFDLAPHALEVARLARAVEGLPLAIELAASCVRIMPVAAILADLATDAGLLDAAAAGPDGAGRGLAASFERSWSLLGEPERRALAALCVFAGDFERAAAATVAAAPLPVLAALVDRSLVRANPQGTFSLHPLVRGFSRARLADAAALQERHARYFTRELEQRLRSAGAERLRRVGACIPDAIAAWQWAGAVGDAEALARLAGPLTRALDEAGRWAEGIELLRAAEAAAEGPGARRALARAEIARGLAALHYRRGELDAVERRARESLRIATACRSLKGADVCLNLIGGALRQRGRWKEARGFFERALRRAQAGGDAGLALRVANNLATVEMATGFPERTIGMCEALLAEHGEGDDKLGVAMTLVILGNANNATRRLPQAQRCYERGLEIAERHRLVTMAPFFLQTLGSCHREQGHLELAREFYIRALATPAEFLEPQLEIYAALGLGRVEIAAGGDEAAAMLARALRVARRTGSAAWQAAVVAGWGELHASRGEVDRAALLLAFAAASPAIDANLAREAGERLASLGLAPERLEDTRGAAAAASLERVVEELLAP